MFYYKVTHEGATPASLEQVERAIVGQYYIDNQLGDDAWVNSETMERVKDNVLLDMEDGKVRQLDGHRWFMSMNEHV